MTVRTVAACRVCGHDDWAEVASFGDRPLPDAFIEPAASYATEPKYPLDVILCRHCGLMCLRHVVSAETLYDHYAYVSPRSELMTGHMSELAERCARWFDLAEDELVVELGSNAGLQLEHFAKLGARVLGVDPARNIAKMANDNGIETLPLFFGRDTAAEIRAERGPAKLILGRHVFAHVDDLTDLVAGVRELLDERGGFVIEMPYLVDLLASNQFDTIYHEHLSYFSVRTLCALFARHGMRVIDVVRVPVHGGSIVVAVAPEHSDRPTSAAVGELLDLEREAGLNDVATYHAFTERVEDIVSSVRKLVKKIVAEGRTVAGYGAPAKGTMLLAACGFDQDDLVFCADTTTIKQGLVTPGSHIPVRSPAHAAANPPDHYLLLAWNYRDEILRKEQAYLDAGGRFIVPIPSPEVLP